MSPETKRGRPPTEDRLASNNLDLHQILDARVTYGEAQHEAIEYEVLAAWHDGYQQCLIDVAARGYELDDAWKLVARKTADRWIAERLALFEECAAKLPGNTWRGRYPGGAVDFDTGRPVRRLEMAA